jgi:hypothetical protein
MACSGTALPFYHVGTIETEYPIQCGDTYFIAVIRFTNIGYVFKSNICTVEQRTIQTRRRNARLTMRVPKDDSFVFSVSYFKAFTMKINPSMYPKRNITEDENRG